MTLIKWVTCAVTDTDGFHTGQSGWGELRARPGFLGQSGGWSRNTPGYAHVFGLWHDHAAYRAFMAGPHDRLAAAQAGTYRSIEVRLFEAIETGLSAAGLVRLAHCRVHPGLDHDFVRAQQTVWTPGMAAAPGFRGCSFGTADAPGRPGQIEFLVLSGWASAADHDLYRRDRFPGLYRRSGAAGHLAAIDGDLIDTVPEWTV
ncbi:hypothetical protein FHR83_003901 [Actinoplanes campanulatus]|uniref:DUF4937 domain-containing protein n=1 Tax=Actinoplanes campanulatus TaxID=113559 RepID=A0A7W5AHM3_9ACTN|nr:YdbC family protein [Actinoplanes campanulatus]MBB3096231.1 hypothetical protein [Actinoplanes campanulatus]GGN51154.1 DUF4937 domain-containing protein [Actinoplanes campanulatus]GID42545.1 DUF4937 domain-containing protein [Actinoplanes campanulatus]